jgi:hypothetical protein
MFVVILLGNSCDRIYSVLRGIKKKKKKNIFPRFLLAYGSKEYYEATR